MTEDELIAIINNAAPVEPAEFITNGAFAADTDWTKGAGWTIAAGVATQTSGSGVLTQDFGALVATLINGQTYNLTFDVTAGDGGGDIIITVGSQSLSAVTTTVGAKSRPFTATDEQGTINLSCLDAVIFSIDNVSLVPT